MGDWEHAPVPTTGHLKASIRMAVLEAENKRMKRLLGKMANHSGILRWLGEDDLDELRFLTGAPPR